MLYNLLLYLVLLYLLYFCEFMSQEKEWVPKKEVSFVAPHFNLKNDFCKKKDVLKRQKDLFIFTDAAFILYITL